MSTKCEYRVEESGLVIARFFHVDDAQQFAELVTANGSRTVSVHDSRGWVDFYYANGFTTSIRG
jgi:hypothetical protein